MKSPFIQLQGIFTHTFQTECIVYKICVHVYNSHLNNVKLFKSQLSEFLTMRAALKLVERAAQLQKKTLLQGSSYLKGAAAGAQQQQIRQLGQDSGSSSIYTRQTRSVSLGPSSQVKTC